MCNVMHKPREEPGLGGRINQPLFSLAQTLKKNGVERYAPMEGDAFDADLHNAMFDVPAPPSGGEGMDPGRVAMLIKVRACGSFTRS